MTVYNGSMNQFGLTKQRIFLTRIVKQQYTEASQAHSRSSWQICQSRKQALPDDCPRNCRPVHLSLSS